MSDFPAIPEIPASSDPAVKKAIDAIRQVVLTMTGKIGGDGRRFVRRSELDSMMSASGAPLISQNRQPLASAQTSRGGQPGSVEVSQDLFSKLMQSVNDYINSSKLAEELRASIGRIDQDLINRIVSAEGAIKRVETNTKAAIGAIETVSTGSRSASARRLAAMVAEVSNPDTGLSATRATILQEYLTSADTNQAISKAISTLEASVSKNYASIQQMQKVVADASGALSSLWTLKEDVNGKVAGVGLYNDGVRSSFYVSADDFAILDPATTLDANGKPSATLNPFIVLSRDVTQQDGTVLRKGAYINGALNIGGINLSTVASNASVPPINDIGSFSTAPQTTGLKKNSVYLNTTDGNSYILNADGGTWGVWLQKGQAGAVGQGQVKGICFLRSATTPSIPVGGSYASPTATGWSDGVPAGTDPLYMTTRIFTSDGKSPQQVAWTTPQLTSSFGQGTKVQFSVDGSTSWHDTPSTNDYYMRTGTSTDGGTAWTYAGAVKIKGEQGAKGDAGLQGSRGTSLVTSTATTASDSAFTSASSFPFAIDGDQLLLTNSAGSQIYKRSGGYWYNSTVFYVKGDAVIDGTLAASKFSSNTTGSTQWNFGGSTINGANVGCAFTTNDSSWIPAGVVNYSLGGIAFGALAYGGTAGWFKSSGYGAIIASGVGGSNCGGYFYSPSGKSIYLANSSYAFQTGGGAVGSFTGAHDGLLPLQQHPDVGDIMIDYALVRSRNVDDTICENVVSWLPNQKGALGVFAGFADNDHVPTSLLDDVGSPISDFSTYQQKYRFAVINALGEGLINVCGENGDIEAGDLIVTSSIPGKGMKQPDDLVRSVTVAKSRESATFDSPGQVKQIACIYMCG